jgi:hypothetical protein
MFDTREQHKTLKSVTRVYLTNLGRGKEINRLSDVLRALQLSKGSSAGKYAKRHGLKNKVTDYVVLLEYIEEQMP